jgi:hypothetical protein
MEMQKGKPKEGYEQGQIPEPFTALAANALNYNVTSFLPLL